MLTLIEEAQISNLYADSTGLFSDVFHLLLEERPHFSSVAFVQDPLFGSGWTDEPCRTQVTLPLNQ